VSEGTANPPAFPRSGGRLVKDQEGMTLRDYFAGQALTGWLARLAPNSVTDTRVVAKDAYAFADAMLAERER